MVGFIEGAARDQTTLFPAGLEDWVGDDSLVRVVDLFVEEIDLPDLGFAMVAPARTGQPGYYPAVLLKLFIYGYLKVRCLRRPTCPRRAASCASLPFV